MIVKVLILLAIIFGRVNPALAPKCLEKYHIEIVDHDYSLAYVVYYTITSRSLKIAFIDGVDTKNKFKLLLQRSLLKSENDSLCNFFLTHNIYRLKEKYRDPLTEDGNIQTFYFSVNGRKKSIYVANSYQKDIASFLNLVNKIVGKKYEIHQKTQP